MPVFVFDVETDALLPRPATESDWASQRLTVAVGVMLSSSYCFSGDGGGDGDVMELVFDAARTDESLGRLKAALDAADAVVAYNGREFDLRVLLNYYDRPAVERWCAKLRDPFEVIRATTGSWVKLDELLEANGLERKAATGVDAVQWWASGEVDKLLEYCRQDAVLLARLVGRPVLRFPVKRWEAGAPRVVKWSRLKWHDFVVARPSPPPL